jgi:general secretion pathway protein G
MRPRLFARQARPRRLRRQRGFSRFELAVAAALFAALVGIAASRLNWYQQQAESVAAEQLIATLRVALQFRISHLTAAQRPYEVLTITDENPIDWLSEKPKNYLGEYYSPDNKKLTKGCWYFDRDGRTLVYLLTHQKSFAFRSSILLKFKVKSLRLPLKPVQQDQSGPIESIALVQVFDE